MVEELSALGLLQEEMNSDDIEIKVSAIYRMKIVILAIGVEETSRSLVDYLDSLIDHEEDEVLFAMADELGKVWELIPNKTLFLGLLEKLCTVDETVVRDQAAKSMAQISVALNDAEIQGVFTPMVLRLAQAEWFFGRVSACHLFAAVYPRAHSKQERLRKKFVDLCQEDNPMIRRACAAKFGEFAVLLDKHSLITDFMPMFRALAHDDQDEVRVLATESLIPIATYLTDDENRIHSLGAIITAGSDKSWKVRLCFAKKFAKFAAAFGKDITDNNFIQTFTKLLTDTE